MKLTRAMQLRSGRTGFQPYQPALQTPQPWLPAGEGHRVAGSRGKGQRGQKGREGIQKCLSRGWALWREERKMRWILDLPANPPSECHGGLWRTVPDRTAFPLPISLLQKGSPRPRAQSCCVPVARGAPSGHLDTYLQAPAWAGRSGQGSTGRALKRQRSWLESLGSAPPGQHRARAGLAQSPCPPPGPKTHVLTLLNPLPAGPPVAQEEGHGAQDHHQ